MDRARALKYFQSVNQARFERLRQLAPSSQQPFYALLAFLFHANHKLLPGYVSDEAPVGIMDYRPDSLALNAAISLHKTFNYKHKTLRRYALRGIYLLNPQGNFSYPSPCRLSLWLVHTGRMSTEQLELLQRKTEAILAWAAQLGIVIDSRLFAEAELQSTAGPTGLELDAFYSSGMVLAGSVPLWWLTSSEEDRLHDQHSRELINQRVFTEFSFLDFSVPAAITAMEYFSEAEQALLAVMQQGLTKLPELLFQVQQLQRFPEVELLSSRSKNLIDPAADPLLIDPLMLKYQSLIDAETEHREILQSAIHQRAREALSKTVQKPAHPWRRLFVQKLCESWQWSDRRIETEDLRMQGHYRQRQSDWQQCQNFLTSALSSCQQFALKHDLAVSEQLQTLSRHLNLWTAQVVAGRLPVLPPLQQPVQAEEQLQLSRASAADSHWQLFAVNDHEPLFSSEHLLEVLAFAVVNKILDRSSLIRINDAQQRSSSDLIRALSQRLIRSALAEGSQWCSMENLIKTSGFNQLMIFANIGQAAHDALSEQGLKVSSRQDDPLSYSSNQISLISRLEMMIRAADGQWHYQLFDGPNAISEMLAAILRWSPTDFFAASLSTDCMTELYGNQIAERLQQLTRHCLEHYQRFPQAGRYLLPLRDRLVQLDWQPGNIDSQLLPASMTVTQWLAQPRDEFHGHAVDVRLDPQGLYRLLANAQSTAQISCFLRLETEKLVTYIVDEHGCTLTHEYQNMNESAVLHQLQLMLTRIKETNSLQRLRFYRLRYREQWQIEVLTPPASSRDYLPVQVELSNHLPNAEIRLYFGDTTFSGSVDDSGLYQQIRQWLSSRNTRLPLQITRISFSDNQYYAGSHYLLQKFQIERRLNQSFTH
ncbi:class I adenylate cyclase [Methylophaga lonarensis]|uniref:class I adenylate cyclase n=1 Tax=Methylophaga lonarensis TaxID=999151 RepID=UPI003D2AC41E